MSKSNPAAQSVSPKSSVSKRPWVAPGLTRLEPGTPEHDRAVAAFTAAGLIKI